MSAVWEAITSHLGWVAWTRQLRRGQGLFVFMDSARRSLEVDRDKPTERMYNNNKITELEKGRRKWLRAEAGRGAPSRDAATL